MEEVKICAGCGTKGADLIEHHWPQSIPLRQARRLGQTRWVCSRCNSIFKSLFPKIEEVPWETQKESITRYLEIEQARSTSDKERHTVERILQCIDREGGLRETIKNGTLLSLLDSNPSDQDLLTDYLRLSLDPEVSDRERLTDLKASENLDWKKLTENLQIIKSMKPQEFWTNKVPVDFLPYVGILEFNIRSGQFSKMEGLLEKAARGALTDILVSAKEAELKPLVERLLQDRALWPSPTIEDSQVVDLVLLGLNSLEEIEDSIKRKYTVRKFGGEKRYLLKCQTIANLVLGGTTTLLSLDQKYREVYSNMGGPQEYLAALETWGLLTRQVLVKGVPLDTTNLGKGPYDHTTSNWNILDYLIDSLDSLERRNYELREVSTKLISDLSLLELESTTYLPTDLLSNPPTLEELYYRRHSKLWTFILGHPYGIKTWEEAKLDLLYPTRYSTDIDDYEDPEEEE